MSDYGVGVDITGEDFPNLSKAVSDWSMLNVVLGYNTGTDGVDWISSEWTYLQDVNVGSFKYDQSAGLALFASGAADGADVERGAGTLATAIQGCIQRAKHGWYSWIYCAEENLAAGRLMVKENRIPKVQFILADWNLTEDAAVKMLGGDIAAVQWASPTSNPATIVPGTRNNTLAELNCDLNVTLPGWFARRNPPVVVKLPTAGIKSAATVTASPAKSGIVVGSDLTTAAVSSTDGKTWVAS